jgi:arylsulfatase A-like enzyme
LGEQIKKKWFLFLLAALIGVLPNCQKRRYQYIYVNLADFFPYLTRGVEVSTMKFVGKDLDESRYRLSGFKTYSDQLPRNWAVEKESTITAFFTEPEDKEITLRCRPFNPPGQPLQEGEIFFNGTLIKKLVVAGKGRYRFDIPAGLMVYGSNRLTFKWKFSRSHAAFNINNDKRKYAVGFSYLTWRSPGGKKIKTKTHRPIQIRRQGALPALHIPQGALVEYFVDLPADAQVRFKLASDQGYLEDQVFHLAIYGQTGEKLTRHFKSGSLQTGKEYLVELDRFARQTVKIVFANSIRNHPNFLVKVINPAVYTISRQDLPVPSRWVTAAGEQKQDTPRDITPGPLKRSPNVFIYLVDTLRADHMSCYGYSRKTTPRIDAFAGNALLFKNCFASASWTKPAVGSILTGLYPNKHRAEDQNDKMSADVQTLAEVLKTHGYQTVYITPNVNAAREVNFDQGIDYYLFSRCGANLKTYYRSSEYLNSEFFEILGNNPQLLDKPLFAYLHTIDPHDPYTPEEPFLTFKKNDRERENLGIPDYIRQRKASVGLSREDLDYIKALYDCEILHNDYYFGEFLEGLKARNLYENSIIIFVADHGEQFDEHDVMFHGHSIYNEEIHVPLIIKFPGREFSGQAADFMVSQVDIFPTLLDYLGIGMAGDVDGISIFNLLAGKSAGRTLFVKEELNRDERDKSNFLGLIDTAGKTKQILTYKNESFLQTSKVEAYHLDGDFAEQRDQFPPGDVFLFHSVKFLADYFLQQAETFFYREADKLDLRKLDPEKVKQLKALGYIN